MLICLLQKPEEGEVWGNFPLGPVSIKHLAREPIVFRDIEKIAQRKF